MFVDNQEKTDIFLDKRLDDFLSKKILFVKYFTPSYILIV